MSAGRRGRAIRARLVALAVALAATIAAVACGDDRPRERPSAPTPPAPRVTETPPEPAMTDASQEPAVTDAAAVPLTYEGVALQSSLDELIAQAAAHGWRQNAQPGDADQIVTVFTTPDHPVKRYKLGFEAGRLVNIEIDYRQPDPARVALRDQFPQTRDHDGVWYLTDVARTVLASVDADGKRVRALHLRALRDKREGDALLRAAFGPPPAGSGH